MAQLDHFSLRLDRDTRIGLERQAAKRHESKTRLAAQYLLEAVRVADHPGIAFRDGPAGRRPAVVGGPDVWEVVQVFLDEGRRAATTADTLSLSRGQVEAAIGYYADHSEDIDAWIESNHREAEAAEAAWRRRQALISG